MCWTNSTSTPSSAQASRLIGLDHEAALVAVDRRARAGRRRRASSAAARGISPAPCRTAFRSTRGTRRSGSAPTTPRCRGTSATVRSRPSAKWTCASQPSSLAQLVGGERVAAVVAGAVGDVLDQRLVGAGQLDHPLDHLDVLALVGAADVVGLAGPALHQHRVDAAAEVLDVEPVADLLAVAVDRQRVAVERVQDHQRDQLLRVLARAVVVGAAARSRPRSRRCGRGRRRAGRRPPWSPSRARRGRAARSR